MKKLMMIAAFVVACVSANAQYKPGTWSIQPKAGVGFSTVTGNPANLRSETKTGIAAMIGGEFEYQYNNYFSFAAGLNYSAVGCALEKHELSSNKINLGYINIPLVVNVYVTKGLAFKAGAQVGFNVYKKWYMEDKNGNEVNVNLKDGDTSMINAVDFSIPVGVSYEFSHVVIDARYNIGLTNVIKKEYSGDKSNKNSVFMVTGGYKFSL